MSKALKILKVWANSCGLSINPSKIVLVIFTKKTLFVMLTLPYPEKFVYTEYGRHGMENIISM